jgi:hypothetical protein
MSTPNNGGESILTDALYFIDEMERTAGELVAGVSQEVVDLADGYVKANSESGATREEVENAAYFAKSVADPEKYPPRDGEMEAAVKDRQASEEVARNLREATGHDATLSPEEEQQQMEERMRSQLDHQKAHEMC